MRCGSSWKDEFTNSKLVLSSPSRVEFATSKWLKSLWFLLWRVMVTMFLITTLLWYPLEFGTVRHLTYISNWSYIFLTLYFIIATVVTLLHLVRGKFKKHSSIYQLQQIEAQNDVNLIVQINQAPTCDTLPGDEENRMTWIHKTMWVLYNINISITLLVAFIFWGMLSANNLFGHGIKWTFFQICYHALNGFIMILENILCSVPCHLLHFYHSILFGVAYVMFTLLLWVFDGIAHPESSSIYKFLDYDKKPAVAIISIVIVVLVLTPACFVMQFCVYKMRSRFQKFFYSDDETGVVGSAATDPHVIGVV